MGLLFLFSKSKAKELQFVVQSVQQILEGWKAYSLFRPSHTVLPKSVGMTILPYAMVTIPLPMKIAITLTQLSGTFSGVRVIRRRVLC